MPAQRRSHDQGRTAVEALQVGAHVHVHAPRHRSPRAVQLPRTPTGLLQAVVQGTAMRAVASGSWIDSGHVHLSVHLARPLTPRRAQVQVEIHPLAVPFNGRADHSGPAFSYHGTSASVAAVDVAGLPDGAYHWRARIHDLGGPSSHWTTSRVFYVYRGRPAAPAIRLATPHLGAAWVATRRLTIRWAPVRDAPGIAGYAVAVTRNPSATPPHARPARARSLMAQLPGDGTWYVLVVARNRAGAWGRAARLAVHVDATAPRLDGVSVPSAPLDPRHTPTIAHMRLSHAARIVAEVVDAAGRVVRSIPTHVHPAGYHMVIGWDGRDGRGRLVHSGTYRLRMSAFNRAGVAWRVTRTLHIETAPPALTSGGLSQQGSYNPYDNSLDGAEDITATVDQGARLRIEVRRGTRTMRAWTMPNVQAGQVVTATWDGTNGHGSLLPSGPYTIRAIATDAVGNEATWPLGTVSLDLRRIVISLDQQRLWALDGKMVLMTTLVTTGGPELPTPTGDFQIIDRESPFTFHSPFPPSSPYWYPDSPTTFALLFQVNGYFIHDAPWRSYYGPGSNTVDGKPGGNTTGTHGCVNVPYDQMSWLFQWATMYTPVQVRQDITPA